MTNLYKVKTDEISHAVVPIVNLVSFREQAYSRCYCWFGVKGVEAINIPTNKI